MLLQKKKKKRTLRGGVYFIRSSAEAQCGVEDRRLHSRTLQESDLRLLYMYVLCELFLIYK